ncbi:MAG TPA: four helix bundle protein [Tepidisphaeraceae bacterium]|nr:four helix bundle protein [Tepidisphaeraceae bacterium]
MPQNYQDLVVWQKSMDLVEMIYQITRGFPKDELYGLVSQMRRAALSIPCNIAEGQGRGGKVEFARFLRMAYGSLREIETQLLIAHRLTYTQLNTRDNALALTSEVGRLLNGLMNSLT